jgi:hypothetical protein
MRHARIVPAVCAVLLALSATVFGSADDTSDLADLTRELQEQENVLKTLVSKHEAHIRTSRDLRSFDEEQLKELIVKLCGLDEQRDGTEAKRIADGLERVASERVQEKFDDVFGAGDQLFREADYLSDQFERLADEADDLDDSTDEEVKKGAIALVPRINVGFELAKKMVTQMGADLNSLSNVKSGTMLGANNATIRAKMDYGKLKHQELQRTEQCDAKEVTLSSGRPDCVRFIENDCQVVEFKPDTYSESDAARQAERYVKDVQNEYKDLSAAKTCRQVTEGDVSLPVFRPVGYLYPACRP